MDTQRVRTYIFPHILVYGPSGAGGCMRFHPRVFRSYVVAGKKTRIVGILKELYGAGAEKVHLNFSGL